MKKSGTFLLAVGAAALMSGNPALVYAQAYPTKPVRIVVPYSPGGGTDTVTRALAQRMTDSLGQQVVIENRAGANGIIGSELVAKAQPDGYLLLMMGISAHRDRSFRHRDRAFRYRDR